MIMLASCQKADITLLQGSWINTQGLMTTTIKFLDNNRYSIDSYVLAEDRKSIIQTCPLSGDYTAKLSFRIDGQSFDWIENGKLKGNTLILNDKFHGKKLNFIKI